MLVIRARNVHEALRTALLQLLQHGVRRHSRNGPVLAFPEPVTTVYERPLERWLFWPERDANPFLHFAESLWMLAGRNDLAFLTKFAASFEAFSDDGKTLNGAYGHRWRRHFGHDQLTLVIEALRADPNDRRAVLQMWDGHTDCYQQALKKDVPCNTAAYFSVTVDGAVDMLVSNRSNDMLWGAYGANAVHFSYLHEFVANSLQRKVGVYRQVSNNLHMYMNDQAEKVLPIALAIATVNPNPYEVGGFDSHYSLLSGDSNYPEFLSQLDVVLPNYGTDRTLPGMMAFFRRVAVPVLQAHAVFKDTNLGHDRYDHAIEILKNCKDSALSCAAVDWINRRQEAAIRKLTLVPKTETEIT